ncbi:MAG: LuxR C-terminal-related transcriptional regulator [Deferribacterales bacterium]
MILSVFDTCLNMTSEEKFEHLLKDIAEYIGFRYVLCCYTPHHYVTEDSIRMINISNPKDWMEFYNTNNLLVCDPVRIELEKRIENNIKASFIIWDAYERKLSVSEKELIRIRKQFGLEYGFSVYEISDSKDFGILISFADPKEQPDNRTIAITSAIVTHIMAARKRLNVVLLLNCLSDKEHEACHWILNGKTNWEIAKILNISENTVKFHLKNIYAKTGVSKRQQLISILMAEKYMHL